MRSDDPTAALLIGMAGGLWFFFKGFRVMREYRVLEDTPRMPIRSVPMGFVHIRGKAESTQLLSSPLTKTPCCFYKVEIEQWKSEGDTHQWTRVCTDFNGYQFHLRDDTGAILIDAHSAEYDLQPTVTRTVNSNAQSPHADDAQLLAYVTQAQGHSTIDRMGQWVDKRFDKANASDQPQLQEKREAFKELFAGMASFQQGGKAPVQAVQAMEKLINASGPLSDPVKEQRRQMMLQNMKLAEAASASGLLDNLMRHEANQATGQFRLREYVVTPGQEYLISGSCVPNSDSGAPPSDRSMIARGKNEPTFVISTKTDAQIHHTMQWRALKMIFGGAAVALGCAAGLLIHFGLFK